MQEVSAGRMYAGRMRRAMSRRILATALSLVMLLLTATGALAEESPASPEVIRTAIGKALPLLAKAAEGHIAQRTCFACHNQALPVLAFTTARQRALPVPALDLHK